MKIGFFPFAAAAARVARRRRLGSISIVALSGHRSMDGLRGDISRCTQYGVGPSGATRCITQAAGPGEPDDDARRAAGIGTRYHYKTRATQTRGRPAEKRMAFKTYARASWSTDIRRVSPGQRVPIPPPSVAAGKRCLEISSRWSADRVQWGRPIGQHDAIAQKIGAMAANTFAMEAVAELCGAMAERGGYDIRLEAAIAKLWNTEVGWRITDDLLQIKGGRGYETAASLRALVAVRELVAEWGSSSQYHELRANDAADELTTILGGKDPT